MLHSEFDLIALIRQRAHKGHARRMDGLTVGIGDDAAVIRQRAGHGFVITADLLVEEIDFRRASMPPRFLGHKALAVSLSDIAAMGARPCWAMLSIGVPRSVWRSRFLEHFYEGFFTLAEQYEVALIGGDVSRTPEHIVIDSMAIGETQRSRAVRRTGARPGDYIFVTGALGGAAAGLLLLDGGARPASGKPARSPNAVQQLLFRHFCPTPRVAWGILLGEKRLATAMIDISDGLSSDLAHLCHESGVGAELGASRIPIDPLIARIRGQNWDARALALHGGEDFELLFTVRPRQVAHLPQEVGGVPITCIGNISGKAGRITISDERGRLRALKPAGFEHFKRERKNKSHTSKSA